MLSGVGALVYSIIQSKGASVVRKLDDLTAIDLSKLLLDKPKTVSRLEALQQCEALMAYFESTGSVAGQEAMQEMAKIIFMTNGVK